METHFTPLPKNVRMYYPFPPIFMKQKNLLPVALFCWTVWVQILTVHPFFWTFFSLSPDPPVPVTVWSKSALCLPPLALSLSAFTIIGRITCLPGTPSPATSPMATHNGVLGACGNPHRTIRAPEAKKKAPPSQLHVGPPEKFTKFMQGQAHFPVWPPSDITET